MPTAPSRYPLFSVMFGNATLLSGVYLAMGLAVESIRRFHTTRWAEKASLAMESLPGRLLEVTGMLRPLRDAYVYGQVSEFTLQLIFGATTVLIIFAMALGVGMGMWTLRRLWAR